MYLTPPKLTVCIAKTVDSTIGFGPPESADNSDFLPKSTFDAQVICLSSCFSMINSYFWGRVSV